MAINLSAQCFPFIFINLAKTVQVFEIPAIEDHTGIQEFLPLHPGHDPDDGIFK
jgi:hypothetical protein